MPTLLDKIWAQHLVAEPEDGEPLIYCDRHLVHEVTSPQAFEGLRLAGRKLRRPGLTLAVEDHVTPTDLWRKRPLVDEMAEAQLTALETNCAEFGVKLFGMGNPRQGVIHVTLPELGFILPGQTVFCGDSHTTTHGAMGALAFGVGTSQVEHIMATQCLRQAKPKAMAVKIKGELPQGVTAKDLILAIIAQVGFGGGAGFVLEYMGPAITALNMDQRMTVANMAVECGARGGIIAPDETTFAYLKGRPLAPAGADWDQAVAEWKELKSDPDAKFDRVLEIDAAQLEPRLTWGTNPAQNAAITQAVPDPASLDGDAEAAKRAMDYMGITPGQPLAGLPVDVVFIGSCTNGRITDLRQAAAMVRGRRRAPGVRAMVVPGSGEVKAQAEAEGLDQIFLRAGFEWREAGCSMCLGMNPDLARAGERCASTSNRNFEGRQGPGARTHLVSPAMAAASALTGRLTDPRELEG